MQKTKQIKILPYNPNWPEIFKQEAYKIQSHLKEKCLEIYHIGSTSIEGMCAKEDIDILCIVDDLKNALALKEIGYIFKGEFNIPLRYCFSKNTAYSKVNLHITQQNHGFIKLQLAFRDYLRSNPGTAKEYACLKEQLIQKPTSHQKTNSMFTGYTLGKNEFIKNILAKAGFNDLIVNLCVHNKEWDEYHRIRNEQIFLPTNIEYDKNHETITAQNHYHFVLYHGVKIVSTAHIEFLGNKEAALRTVATDTKDKKKGYAKFLIEFLEKWMKSQSISTIKLHSTRDAEAFYRKLGYLEMRFDDQCMIEDYTDLGKSINS